MHGLTIASTWITFAAILAALILYVLSGKYSMKVGATDADMKKAKQLAMAAFWVLVVGFIFGLIGAISASCSKPGLQVLRDLRDRFVRSGAADRFMAGSI